MPRPGVDVTLVDTPGTVAVQSDTGTFFVTGITERGPLSPVLITSMNDYATKLGAWVSYGALYDTLDVFFREGGAKAYVSRVVGPNPTTGALNLLDSGAGVSLVVTANGPGAWSANYKVQVVAGGGSGTYQIKVLDSAGTTVLENSPDLTLQADAVTWSAGSNYVVISLGATANPPAVVAATALSAGTDDRANITDTQWQNALDLFVGSYGPGQVAEPGRTTSTAYSQLTGHASAKNRVALLDAPDTFTSSTLLTSAGNVTSRFAGYFAPWVRCPARSGSTAGPRTVPPCALVAGLIARNDPSLGTNRPAAGNAGVARYCTSVSQNAWDSTTRASLNTAGVNVIRASTTSVKVYGWRSQADPVNDTNWLNFANSRFNMDLEDEIAQVAENYAFIEIDGQNGTAVNGLHDALSGIMKTHFDAGELFGDTADQAYLVDTGPSVNTPTTIQNLELHAIVTYKAASMAEWVQINVVKKQLTESVS